MLWEQQFVIQTLRLKCWKLGGEGEVLSYNQDVDHRVGRQEDRDPYPLLSTIQNCLACSAGDLGFLPGLGRSPRGGHGNPL